MLIVAFAALAAACGLTRSQGTKRRRAHRFDGAGVGDVAGRYPAVFAYTTFMAKAPTLPRPCPAVRETISRKASFPAEVPADSIYALHVGFAGVRGAVRRIADDRARRSARPLHAGSAARRDRSANRAMPHR